MRYTSVLLFIFSVNSFAADFQPSNQDKLSCNNLGKQYSLNETFEDISRKHGYVIKTTGNVSKCFDEGGHIWSVVTDEPIDSKIKRVLRLFDLESYFINIDRLQKVVKITLFDNSGEKVYIDQTHRDNHMHEASPPGKDSISSNGRDSRQSDLIEEESESLSQLHILQNQMFREGKKDVASLSEIPNEQINSIHVNNKVQWAAVNNPNYVSPLDGVSNRDLNALHKKQSRNFKKSAHPVGHDGYSDNAIKSLHMSQNNSYQQSKLNLSSIDGISQATLDAIHRQQNINRQYHY